MVPRYRVTGHMPDHQGTTQLYDEIPANFTLAASSNDHSPHAGGTGTGGLTSPSGPPLQDLYDDVMIKPSPSSSSHLRPTSSKHQYETVSSADDDGADYNQLARSESAVRSSDLPSSRLSRSSVLASCDRESSLFDNPNYAQCKPSGTSNNHINIYRLGSSDSNSGSGSQTRQQWIANSTLDSHSESSGEDVLKYRIAGSNKSKPKRQISNDTMPPPSDQYKHILPEMQEPKESDYAHRIVSSDEKYVSERGHLYQMLEREEVSNGQQKNSDSLASGGSITEDRFVSSKGHIYHILENPAAKENELAKDQQGGEEDQSHIYHILEEPTTVQEVSEDQRLAGAHAQASEIEYALSDPEYDVIESELEQPSIPRRTNQSDYNVVERPEMHRASVTKQPEQHYNVTDRSMDHQPLLRGRSTASIQNRPNPYNVIERNTSASQLPPLDYSVLALDNSDRKDRKFRIETHNPFYDSIDLNNVDDESREHHCTDSGPPVYNSLDATSQQPLSNGMDNAIYHAVS